MVEGAKRLDLPHDLTAGAVRIEHLIKKAKESSPDAIDALTAVGTVLGLGQKPRRQPRAQELIELEETLPAQVPDARTQGGQARPPGRKKRRLHNKYIYLFMA